MLVGFKFFLELDFDNAFMLAVLSGIFYSIYLLVSKKALSQIDVLSFMTISLLASSIYLAIACLLMNEPFTGFTDMGWFVLLLQAVVCQLMAWLSISFATQQMLPVKYSC